MTSADLMREFAARGHRAGRALLFAEETALALIIRAEEEHIAVLDIDQVSPASATRHEPLKGRVLSELDRLASWRRARLFVEALSGRGLYFDVALEPAHATYLGKLRYLFRTGAAWHRGSRAGDETLQ